MRVCIWRSIRQNTLAPCVYVAYTYYIYAGSLLLPLTIHTYKANHSKCSLSSAILRSACVCGGKANDFSWMVRVSQPFICCCCCCFFFSLLLTHSPFVSFVRFFLLLLRPFLLLLPFSLIARAVFPLHVNVAMARLHLTFTQIRTLRCLLLPTFVAIVRLHNVFDWH